jgi:hypothetical protein
MPIIPHARGGAPIARTFSARQLWGPLPWAWQPRRESRLASRLSDTRSIGIERMDKVPLASE